MLYRHLGRTGLSVSEIGFGAASWWGKPQFDEGEAVGLVHAALAGGVTLFDTGSSYSGGHAEERLGRALMGRDVSGLVVATKAGTFSHGGRVGRDFSAAAIVASAERSLRNLGLEVLPLLQLHGPSADEIDRLDGTLAGLRRRGLVRALGVNSFDPAVIDHAIAAPGIDVVMVDYNVLRPEREPLIARAAAAGKGVLAGMPLAMGHLTPRPIRGLRDLWYEARGRLRHKRERELGARFRFLNRLAGVTAAQAALSYVLANRDVASAVVGATRMAHLEQDLAASGMTLSQDVLDAIRTAQKALPAGLSG